MKVKVRCFLPAKDAVVLKRKYSERLIRLDKRLCDSLGRDHYCLAFLMGKIEQRSDMPAGDNATLANFELPGIYHGERVLALIDDRPSFGAACHSFTKVTRISYGKFDQLSSPIQPAIRLALVDSAVRSGLYRAPGPRTARGSLRTSGSSMLPAPPDA